MSSSANSNRRTESRDVKVIRHFSHQHPLRLRRPMVVVKLMPECFLCGLPVDVSKNLSYWCKGCDFCIHTDCAAYPQHTTHPFHPQHALSLSEYNNAKEIECSACGQRKSFSYAKLWYQCLPCKFYLDNICLDLTPESNPQPLVFVCGASEKNPYPSCCSFCHKYFRDPQNICVCLDRKSILHEECFRLARQIVHPFHPDHPLSLVPADFETLNGRILKCNACYKGGLFYLNLSIAYKCLECEFILDTWCASLVPAKSCYLAQPGLQNQPPLITTHSHPLIQCDNVDNHPFRCSACHAVIKDSVFVCLQCCILLDTSCTQLIREIRHPFHHHPLQLAETQNCEFNNNCRVCKGIGPNIFMYTCRMCDFQLDIVCAKQSLTNITKTLVSSFHHHLLVFYETRLDHRVIEFQCDKCTGPCNKYYFVCVGDFQCYFALHLECCPLPQTITHDCHCDPLTLTSYPIEEDIFEYEYGDDIEFYCFACEELRDPDLPTYCCKVCPFIAHLHCVLSEIFRYIEAGPSTVSLQVGNAGLVAFAETIVGEEQNLENKPIAVPSEMPKRKLSAQGENAIKQSNRIDVKMGAGASTDEKFVEEDFCVPDEDTTQEDIDVLDQKKNVEENNASVDEDAIKKEIAAVDQEIEGLQIRIEQLKQKIMQLRLTALS